MSNSETSFRQALDEIGAIEDQVAALRDVARHKLDGIRALLLGRQVRQAGHNYQISQVRIANGGGIDAYGVRVSKAGKIGTRGYHLGLLNKGMIR